MLQQIEGRQMYQPTGQTTQPKKTNWGKILGIGCLIIVVILIILGLVCYFGGKKLLGVGIEAEFQEMKDEILANYERGTLEYDDAKYQLEMLLLLHKQEKVSFMEYIDISEKYDMLKADGEIDEYDAETLLEMIVDFNEDNSSLLD